MPLTVIRNEIDGWDVIEEEAERPSRTIPTRESAEEAAGIRAKEERISEEGGEPVVVDTEHVHAIDDTRQGMRPAFLALFGLLTAVTLLVVILALTGSLTGFGS